MIEIIDLKQEKQTSCRVMICQLNSSDYDWKKSAGLHFLTQNEKILIKVTEFLKIAKHSSVDLVLFPELSIPEKLIPKIQEWSKEQESIVICGSHYHKINGQYISRSPIIIKGVVYFSDKISPSPLEKSPIISEGSHPGTTVIKFTNTFVGNFAVLICADYLNDSIKNELDLNSLDILCVSAFQKDSSVYHRRMNVECENSNSGIYILYSNFLDKNVGDGNSSVFGIMDNLFTQKLKDADYTDLNPDKKLFQFSDDCEYLVAEIDLYKKRPFANRNILTEPNFHLISTTTQTCNNDLTFIQKVAHDDERYKRIDDLFVAPTEYEEILDILDKKNIVFIVGDPGIGKTYTAVNILKKYFIQGYEPVWFAGLEKEEREIQSKVLCDFIPSSNQIVYFEDPFGRTAFERRDSLFQVFSPLLDRLTNLDSKIIITSRKEIFEKFSKESLLENDVLAIKKELNIRNPSYDYQGLCEIFNKLGSIVSDWFDKKDYRKLVYAAIRGNKIASPLAIRDFAFVSRSVKSKSELEEHINRRSNESVKVFALEILSSSITVKSVLYLVYFCGTKGKPFLSELYYNLAKELNGLNLNIASYSFNMEIRSQIGYRIEQFGFSKTAYKFSHPIYEEALSNLILSDDKCELIVTKIIQFISQNDVKTGYAIINRLVIKYPNVALLLFNSMLEVNEGVVEPSVAQTLSQKLISTYYTTKNEEFFKLACHYYSLKKLVYDINNNFSTWKDLTQKLNLCLRYLNNSPKDFDSSVVMEIDWETIFSNKNDEFFTPTKLLHFLYVIVSINPQSPLLFKEKKGENLLKKMYLLLDVIGKKRLYKLFIGDSIQKEFNSYREILIDKNDAKLTRSRLMQQVLFSEKIFYGKIVIDNGAYGAIKKPWLNLLPVGIVDVIGDFSNGTMVGIYNGDLLIGVGMVEYSSDELRKIMGHSSSQFLELIGYYHSSCAIKTSFLRRFKYRKESLQWSRENKVANTLYN